LQRELVADLSRVACRVRDAASSAVVAASVAATRFAAADQNHELTAASESSESVPGKRRGWRRGFRPSAPDSSTPRPEFKQTCSPIARHDQGGHWAENTLQQAGSSVQEKAARTLYISGLHPQTTAVEVSQMLRRAGGVEDVCLVGDPRTGHSRGVGYVEMLTTAACLEALRLSCDRQLICRGLHATVHPVGRPSLTSPGSIDTPSHFAQHNASSLPSDSRHTDSGKGDYHVGPSGVPLTPPSVALADSWAMQTKALTASLKECTEFALR